MCARDEWGWGWDSKRSSKINRRSEMGKRIQQERANKIEQGRDNNGDKRS